MKFVIAVVMLAVALGVESSTVAWGPALSYSSVSAYAPAAHGWGAPAISTAWGNGAWGHDAWGHGAWAAPAAVTNWAAPGIAHSYGASWASPAVVAAPLAHAHEGSYVAKTRGAVHVAPLAGHINSAASINLAPAPGTI